MHLNNSSVLVHLPQLAIHILSPFFYVGVPTSG